MSRRKKILVCALLSLVVVATIGYFAFNIALNRVSRGGMTRLVGLAAPHQLEIVDPSFQSVGISGFFAASWSMPQAGLKLPSSERLWETQGDQLSLDWDISGQARLTVDQVVVTGPPIDQSVESIHALQVPSEWRIELERVQCQFEMGLLNPEKSIRRLLPEFVRLVTEGETVLPLELSGKLSFWLKGKPAEVGLGVSQKKDTYAILLNREDLLPLLDRFEEKLTEAEVDVIAAYPLRAVRLLEIKDRAESMSKRAFMLDATVPQDAYRHILWSFLLTKAYGEDFAKQVGDAHEKGDTGNTASERLMDLHNNAIGRKYAAEQIVERTVLQRVLSDPEIRREP